MSLFEGFETMRLVRAGPGLRQRVERRIAAVHHKAVIARLRKFREQLERDMAPEPWTALEAPMVLLLSDVCDALGLIEEERAAILGQEGVGALADELETRPRFEAGISINDRQAKALDCVRKHGKINLSAYRAICPFWSDETLRLDLADLVARGLLVKNGAKRGTYYKLAE
jgi:hypothetical protein